MPCSPDCSRIRLAVVAFVLTALVIPPHAASSQEIDRLEFTNAPVAEMLVALGRAAGRSIVPDATVTGRASYYFAETTFNEALAAFTAHFGLFVDEADGVLRVSALRVVPAPGGGLAIDAPRVSIADLLRVLSRATGTPILFERLPEREIAYHATQISLEAALSQIAAQLPDHRLTRRDGGFLLGYLDPARLAPPRPEWVGVSDHGYSIASDQARLADLLDLLFAEAAAEYQLLTQQNPQLPPLRFSERPFDELLTLILHQADATFALVNGVYYVTDAPRGLAVARTLVTRTVTPETIDLASLLDLLPPEQAVGVTIRPDRARNTLSLTGTAREVDRLAALVSALDTRPDGRSYHRFPLTALTPADAISLLPRHLARLELTPLPASSALIGLLTRAQAVELADFLALVDATHESTLFELEHVPVERLLANLPVSAHSGRIVPTGDPRRFFFVGPAAARERFAAELARIDRPLPQVRYHLLIIQYQEGNGLEFELELDNALTAPDSRQAFLGSLGKLLSLNFDVVTTFGYEFAANLNARLTNASAAVVADTTLNGLSGEPVRFRNTSTFRYRDVAVDAETGEQRRTGLVREISSGLIVEITGDVTGRTVTMDVAATVSRRGSDGGATGNPPPTSERVLSTRVRAREGEPIILSGLRQDETGTTREETPLLGRIPIIGWLFRSVRRTADSTELAIYIVPDIDHGEPRPADTEAKLYGIFREHFGATP